MEVRFAEDHIRFLGYDFPGASVYPSGMVAPAGIRDADWKAIRPEVRTVLGETLFIPRERKPDLEAFCHRHGIASVSRPDTWGDLLEPFLDTQIGAAEERATIDRLRKAGFTLREIAGIRRRLAPLMLAYNFDAMVWEWVHLGLFDLLTAAGAPVVAAGLRATVGDPAAFYEWAMAIAERHR
ncbi:helix-turn-helix domain-containing protein [Actinomadura montaniterrae]|uniref:Uncharacterized protein n=1 Tax=Actinomadura montaniterrae TaxID=1803903 RepID=A0A6L3VH98_9ACTN|nr:helix-turn-helix domain-containing protein [Actinomadura montaniterrae]KAB2364123.1 hypothetical protein F9B16_42140 [Actinomadura montaniterrae]